MLRLVCKRCVQSRTVAAGGSGTKQLGARAASFTTSQVGNVYIICLQLSPLHVGKLFLLTSLRKVLRLPSLCCLSSFSEVCISGLPVLPRACARCVPQLYLLSQALARGTDARSQTLNMQAQIRAILVSLSEVSTHTLGTCVSYSNKCLSHPPA